MGYERFNRIATGVQALVVAAAVVVGGGWTLYRFEMLEEIERGRAELEQIRRDLRERGILNLTMRVSTLAEDGAATRFARVEVSAENVGDRTELIEWAKSGVTVSRVRVGSDGALVYAQPVTVGYGTPLAEGPSSTILPGQTRVFEFLVPLSAPGTHYVLFFGAASPAEAEESLREHGLEAQDEFTIYWQASTFARIE